VEGDRVVAFLSVFLDEFLCIVSIGVVLGGGEKVGDRGRPLSKQLTPKGLMLMKAIDESRACLIVGDF